MTDSMSDGDNQRSAAWRWSVCGLLLLATMLNYMDRQALAQSATDLGRELGLSNTDYGRLELGFGLAFALGGVVLGVVADRVSLYWFYPAILLGWSAAGLATGRAHGFRALLTCRVWLGFFEAGQWPCALIAAQRLLSRADRTLGNSLLQSGASLGAIATPLVVQALVTESRGTWRGPFLVIGAAGLIWAVAWLALLRAGDVAAPHPLEAEPVQPGAASGRCFARRLLALVVVVIAINLCWHFYRAWLPKLLREQHGYSRRDVNLFTSAYYVATDLGCLSVGLLVKLLADRGWKIERARLLGFAIGALLALSGALAARVPPGPLLLGLLLLVGAGTLALFPIYYACVQEMSLRHQGRLVGLLACTAWVTTALMHEQVGRWVDRTHSYAAALTVVSLLPMAALAGLALLWGRSSSGD